MDEPQALQCAGWAGAASIVLLVVAVALCASVGVDVAFALWLIGAVIGVLRTARRTPPGPAVPTQDTPAPDGARTPPTATSS